MYHIFTKHVLCRSLNLERIYPWLPGDTYKCLGRRKKFRCLYFEKNPRVKRYLQKKVIKISVFCNPVRSPFSEQQQNKKLEIYFSNAKQIKLIQLAQNKIAK